MKPYSFLPLINIVIHLLLGSLEAAQASRLPIAKPNCEDICGDVSIPFPWGVGSGCYRDKWFEIECRDQEASSHHSNTTKLPFLTKLGVEVTDIQNFYQNIDQRIIIRMPPVNACATSMLPHHSHDALALRGSPYSISAKYNVFVMEGCSGSADLLDESNTIVAGCATICQNNNTAVETNTCFGVECCQSYFPGYDLQSYRVRFPRQHVGDHNLGQTCLLASLVKFDPEDEVNPPSLDPEDEVNPPSLDPFGRAAQLALRWRWKRNDKPDVDQYASCVFDRYVSSSWSCFCDHDDYPYLDNPYVHGGCPVPENWHFPDFNFLTSGAAIIVYIVLAIAIAPLLVVFGCRWLYRFTKRRRKTEKRVKFFKLMMQTHQTSNQDNDVADNTKLFTHNEFKKATEHFNDSRVLGKGGQGIVYKGMLTDGRIVAIKKSKQMDETQMKQFINEVIILSQTDHRHVVKLLGCCLETEVPLIAYEYVSNGTLYQHIHDPSEDIFLGWETRLRIVADSAGAILYLHSSSSTPVYHRDIKSANILLDNKYRAKVSDFGSSKTLEIDQTHLTTLVQGTLGYLDPKYFESSVFTEKSDVYSFGVVLLELLTSKKPMFRNESMEQKNLVSEFLFQMQNHGLSNILDPEVVKEAKEEEILAFADLAKNCLNETGRLRPTMKEVAMALEMIIKSPTEMHAREDQVNLVDEGLDEISVIETSDSEFSRSSRTSDPNTMCIDVEPLLGETIYFTAKNHSMLIES